uniref:ShKT domain-containing protein n=2 Tax=Tetraselmis sp. GSL018 TaxID=582737 RepID=A0A061SM16_9CHLO|mmetsp:Transcript_17750/g.42567  ORF Transcript_17750/g.42567 Transcript_17750/m.42567 type:complete len:221 (+) Transcript_17750:149-811(+)
MCRLNLLFINVLVLLVVLQGYSAFSEHVSSSRKLMSECHYDSCGVWCGPPRPPPCGNGPQSSSSSETGNYKSSDHYSPDVSSESHPPIPSESVSPSNDKNPGCYGDLPFGLENCVCNGATIGDAAGTAACGRVFAECQAPAPFAASSPVESIQRVCDTFALDACISAAQGSLTQFSGCADLIRRGTRVCTPAQAKQIFMASVEQQCEPLCKDCVRHPNRF